MAYATESAESLGAAEASKTAATVVVAAAVGEAGGGMAKAVGMDCVVPGGRRPSKIASGQWLTATTG